MSPSTKLALVFLAGLMMFWTGLLLRPPPPGIDMDEVAATDPRVSPVDRPGAGPTAPKPPPIRGDRLPAVATYPLPDTLAGGTNPEPELLFDKRPLTGKIMANVPGNPLFSGALALPTTPMEAPPFGSRP